MKLTTALIALSVLSAGPAMAQSGIETLCGAGHLNEAAPGEDVVANPAGYYIRSLRTQVSHGDPRIIRATGDEFDFCTRSAATPDMNSNQAVLLRNERRLKYLFVPLMEPMSRQGS
ncbi:hypothetical protein [Defluviimonas sp. WL0075]|uniref:Uncharacterized protein n=1 Tax=Albidovulum sediminicola TaxID=2984331 RepID=A0ABT2Z5Q4_9RHOB|nr:hypothetical protein [Defluviimonas sp. WL0075]MCV2866396.1 hypothetical protein [Defluviimonas sp. WL0075]